MNRIGNEVGLRALGLFVCLSSMFLVYPHFTESNASRLVLDSIFTATICLALFQHSQLSKAVRVGYITAGISAMLSTWLAAVGLAGASLIPALYALFFGMSVVLHFRELFSQERVNSGTLLDATCTYILIGLLFASLHAWLLQLDPGSIALPADGTEPLYQLVYFSFITLTTVGYGDVLPQSNATRMLAAYEAIIGQVFVAIVVGLLVGRRLAEIAGQRLPSK